MKGSQFLMNKMPCILGILFLFLMLPDLWAQKDDYHWRFGNYSKSILDFNKYYEEDFLSHWGNGSMRFFITSTVVSNSEGEYLFSYNGRYIEDSSGKLMQRGNNMSESGEADGDILIQGGLALPVPGEEEVYGLLHMSWDYYIIDSVLQIMGKDLHYSVIDMRENDGLGMVVEKRKLLLSDTLGSGKLTATRHANGRDWWILVPKYHTDEYYRILFGEEGPILMDRQSTGLVHYDGLGAAQFSKDGTKYIQFSGIDDTQGSYFYLYDFDRCTGLLSKPRYYNSKPDPNPLSGICLSPDGNILYYFVGHEIYQFDANSLNTEELEASRTFLTDQGEFRDTVGNVIYRPRYFQGGVGPDGKMYVVGGQGRIVTTISYPDEWGEESKVIHGDIILTTINRGSMLHFPNFRLGPLEGSSCDTLGIVNMPLSRWRADQSEEDYLNFRLVDNSDYEPTGWRWDFGDGSMSEERHPIHRFSESGTYEICLTVSNAHGSDTHCETFHVGTVSVGEEKEAERYVSVYPNPMDNDLYIDVKDYYPQAAKVILYDLQGRVVKEQRLYHGSNYMYVGGLPAGMYMYKVEDGGIEMKVGKVVKN